jgi:hypothetical protein
MDSANRTTTSKQERSIAFLQRRVSHFSAIIKEREESIEERDKAVKWLESELHKARDYATLLEQRLEDQNTLVHQLSAEIENFRSSTFWRLTWPLRKIVTTIRVLVWFLLAPFRHLFLWLKARLKHIAVLIGRRTLNSQSMTSFVMETLNRFPLLKGHLRSFAYHNGLLFLSHRRSQAIEAFDSIEVSDLSPRQKSIVHMFHQALDDRE